MAAKPHLTVADQRWLATARPEDGFWWLDTSAMPADTSRLDPFIEDICRLDQARDVLYCQFRLNHAGERLAGLKPAPIPIRPWDRPAGWVTPPVNPVEQHEYHWKRTARRADGPFTREIAARLGYDPADIAGHFDVPAAPALPPEDALAELARWAITDHGEDLTCGRVLILKRPLARGGALVVTLALAGAPQPGAA